MTKDEATARESERATRSRYVYFSSHNSKESPYYGICKAVYPKVDAFLRKQGKDLVCRYTNVTPTFSLFFTHHVGHVQVLPVLVEISPVRGKRVYTTPEEILAHIAAATNSDVQVTPDLRGN